MDLFDGHCDTITRCYRHGWGLGENPGNLDLVRVKKLGRYGQFFALFGDELMSRDLRRPRIFDEEYGIFCREMEKNRDCIVFCRTGAEAQAAFAAGKAAAFLSVEGADLLDCTLERLEDAYTKGVRAINLVWNHANILCGTTAEATDRGLSADGKSYACRMQALGMLIDVSHMSDPGFWDVAELAVKPFIATHSNSRKVCGDPRNLTDDMFIALCKCGGVCGINMYTQFLGLDHTVDAIVAHIEHFLSLGGEKNIAIGGDWDGCYDEMPEGIVDILDAGKIYDRLLQRNHSEMLVHNIFFDNMMRVVSEVCTM